MVWCWCVVLRCICLWCICLWYAPDSFSSRWTRAVNEAYVVFHSSATGLLLFASAPAIKMCVELNASSTTPVSASALFVRFFEAEGAFTASADTATTSLPSSVSNVEVDALASCSPPRPKSCATSSPPGQNV